MLHSKTSEMCHNTGENMTKAIVKLMPLAFLTACTSTGDIHEPPLATSPESAVTVRIHKVISGDNITFTINDVKIYGFGKTSDYEFTTDAGSYMFGYRKGYKKCYAEVTLNAGISYVFNLQPDCTIEMQ
jgi:hypothetical protein